MSGFIDIRVENKWANMAVKWRILCILSTILTCTSKVAKCPGLKYEVIVVNHVARCSVHG